MSNVAKKFNRLCHLQVVRRNGLRILNALNFHYKEMDMKYFPALILVSFTILSYAENATMKTVCPDLLKLCHSAGYVENNTSGKDAWVNCVAPLISGGTLDNVKASPTMIASCKAGIEQLPCTKVLAACQTAGYMGGLGKLPMFDCAFPLVQGTSLPEVKVNPDDLKACKTIVDKQIKDQPCLRVMLACKAAGYSPDNTNGEIFVRNCYLPVLNGKHVENVTVDAPTAAACKAQTVKTGTLTSETQ